VSGGGERKKDGVRVQDCLDYDKDLKRYLSKCDKPCAAKAEGSETSADEEERGCRAREQGSYLPRSGISLEFRIRSVRGRGPSVRALPAKPVEGRGWWGGVGRSRFIISRFFVETRACSWSLIHNY